MPLTTLASRLLALLGPEARAWIEFHSGHRSFFFPWGGAMNDQTARLETVRALIHAVQPAQIVETGTSRGTTAEWLARFSIPVLTIEADELPYHFARRRLARFAHVRAVLGDSAALLRGLPPAGDPVFCYLDAHGRGELPLGAELAAIFERRPRAVVLIDDFAVPDDPGYGANAGIDLAYLARCALPATTRLFLPAVPSSEETGHRRGGAVITADPDLAARLAAIALLRPWPLGGRAR